MIRPEWCPRDIWERACKRYLPKFPHLTPEKIALGIMAVEEHERSKGPTQH